jgi:type I restriction enzyme S subunit
MTRGIPNADDILFTTEAPLGNIAMVPEYRIALAQRIIVLCPDRSKICSGFYFWALLSPAIQERIQFLGTGSTVLGIKQSTLRKLLVPIPSLPEQESVYKIMDSIQSTIDQHTAYLKKLRKLKSGLMNDLLTGKVRVRVEEPAEAEG